MLCVANEEWLDVLRYVATSLLAVHVISQHTVLLHYMCTWEVDFKEVICRYISFINITDGLCTQVHISLTGRC